jgi:hypothetical protein
MIEMIVYLKAPKEACKLVLMNSKGDNVVTVTVLAMDPATIGTVASGTRSLTLCFKASYVLKYLNETLTKEEGRERRSNGLT